MQSATSSPREPALPDPKELCPPAQTGSEAGLVPPRCCSSMAGLTACGGSARGCCLLSLTNSLCLLGGVCEHCHIVFHISSSGCWGRAEGGSSHFFLRAEQAMQPQKRNVMMKESYCSNSSSATWIALEQSSLPETEANVAQQSVLQPRLWLSDRAISGKLCHSPVRISGLYYESISYSFLPFLHASESLC